MSVNVRLLAHLIKLSAYTLLISFNYPNSVVLAIRIYIIIAFTMSEVHCFILLSLVVRIRSEMGGYIVGGQPASIKKFPYAVYLYVAFNHQMPCTCGASIINQDIILTAAHCLYGLGHYRLKSIHISVGDSNRNRGQKITAKTYALHEHYDDYTNTNDIALIKTRTSFSLNSKISRVALMASPPPIQEAQVSGWGLIDDKFVVPNLLQHITQRVWLKAKCEKTFGYLPPNTLCAQSRNDRQYVSRGDSGSALVINGYIQIGIVSFKRPSVSHTLIVYTNVSNFIEWIRDTTKNLYCNH